MGGLSFMHLSNIYDVQDDQDDGDTQLELGLQQQPLQLHQPLSHSHSHRCSRVPAVVYLRAGSGSGLGSHPTRFWYLIQKPHSHRSVWETFTSPPKERAACREFIGPFGSPGKRDKFLSGLLLLIFPKRAGARRLFRLRRLGKRRKKVSELERSAPP